jgi:DEAD/DEAH box helicase domain-containing protein
MASTFRSLPHRLSGRLLEDGKLGETLALAARLLEEQDPGEEATVSIRAFESMAACFAGESTEISFETDSVPKSTGMYKQVILPGNKGLNLTRNNEEFEVEHVFYHPAFNGLAYRGRHMSTTGESVKETIGIDSLVEIPGESKTGMYNFDTGEIEEFDLI